MRAFAALCLFLPVLQAETATPDPIRAAAVRAIAVIQKGATGFYKSQDCFSCHDHALPMLAFRMARQHGIPVDEAAAALVAAKGLRTTPDLTSIDKAVQYPTIIDPAVDDGWALLAATSAGLHANLVTAVYARRLATWQRPDGHWPTGDARPPQSSSIFTATAVAIRTLQIHMPAELRKETSERLARARNWLLTAQPHDTEDCTFRLFGLRWAGAPMADYAPSTLALLALQRPNGGWAQLPHLDPDAYSTGEALVALHEAGGVPIADPAWQKGLAFLLSTQEASGAWHVHTRMTSPASVSPPYIESGFPHGHDQFVSTSGTCWAAMALMLALPKSDSPASPKPLPALAPPGLQLWMKVALFGTADELKAKLDAGLDPNTKTPEGTSLLMMAASDPAKVKLLLDRGALANAKAKSGFNALTVAATYYGSSESVKLLLNHGAEARPGTGVMFNASPLLMAAMAGDAQNIALLAAHHADPNRRMNLLGMFPTSPLFSAVGFGDPDIICALIAAGADIHEKDKDGMTALHWAIVAHHADAAKALLNAHADINAADNAGYTPLLYAAAIDFGDTETAKALLAAGADAGIKDKQGKTAQAHASSLPYLRAIFEPAVSSQ